MSKIRFPHKSRNPSKFSQFGDAPIQPTQIPFLSILPSHFSSFSIRSLYFSFIYIQNSQQNSKPIPTKKCLKMFVRLQNPLAIAFFPLIFCTFVVGFPELSIRLRFQTIPELEQFLQALFLNQINERRRRFEGGGKGKWQRDDGGNWQSSKFVELATTKVPMLLGTADLGFLIEFQKDFEEEKELALADTLHVDEPLPKVAAQYDYFGPSGGGRMMPNQGVFGSNPFGTSFGDTVNFDFQCKCQAKSALARTMNTPLSSDPNQAAQQQIQQLQEQVRKLQDQINRSQQGKSSFEQFAQMLSLADGLDCSCSGQSTPWNGWPSGVLGGNFGGNPFGGGRMIGGGGPLSQAGGMMGGNGPFIPMPMGSRQIGGIGQFGNAIGTGGHVPMFPGGYPIRMARQT